MVLSLRIALALVAFLASSTGAQEKPKFYFGSSSKTLGYGPLWAGDRLQGTTYRRRHTCGSELFGRSGSTICPKVSLVTLIRGSFENWVWRPHYRSGPSAASYYFLPLDGEGQSRGDPSARFGAPLSRPFPVKGKGVGRSNRLRFHLSVASERS